MIREYTLPQCPRLSDKFLYKEMLEVFENIFIKASIQYHIYQSDKHLPLFCPKV